MPTGIGEKREQGQAVLEMALAVPFLLAFLFLIADMALLGYSYISVTNAVREGARCGAVGGTDAAIAARVEKTSGGLANFAGVTSIDRGPAIGDDISVTASYDYDWITPVGLIPGLSGTFAFSKEATMRMETTPPYTRGSC
ncbi:hypothetical protein HRbin29_00837 [bacterium HR29]|jgi:hypothetical protein|nr:hypothetical protein HRbin29_00837 [bacterium HR29]